jgi:teichuronic acid exporter
MAEEQSLRTKAISGVLWSAFERFGQVGCAFVLQIFLARLLAPEQFGLIAMVTVFITLSNVLIDAGFSQALIQRKEVSDLDVTTVFYFNLFIAVMLAAFLYWLAPFIAGFYEEEELTLIVRFLSINLLFAGLGAVHRAKLTREMRFKKLFYASFPATLLSGLVGIYLAYRGYGVWALVAQSLLMRASISSLFWVMTGWRPSLAFDFACIREMFPYGSRLALSGVLSNGFSNLYVLVIGKLFTPVDVGLFQRARLFQQLPVQNLQAVVGRVAFPLFSSVQDDPVRMKQGLRKAIRLVAWIALPCMAVLAGLSEPMVLVLIGEKWLACVPYLKLLCFVGALYPLHAMNLNLLAAMGRSDLFLRLEVIKKVLIVLNILATYRFGLHAMVLGMIVTSLFALLLNTYYTKKFVDYGIVQQFGDLYRLIVVSAVIWSVTTVCIVVFPEMPWAALLSGASCAVLIGFCGIRWVDREVCLELMKLLEGIPQLKPLSKILFGGVSATT